MMYTGRTGDLALHLCYFKCSSDYAFKKSFGWNYNDSKYAGCRRLAKRLPLYLWLAALKDCLLLLDRQACDIPHRLGLVLLL